MPRITVSLAVFAPTGPGAACSTGSSGAAACDSPTKTTEVDMQNIAFTAPCVSATANDTLSLVNKDTTEHTYTVKGTSINVTIEGHTDSIGTSEYNLALGERRSNSVRDYLIKRGIAMNRLRTVSYGEERPIATNDTAAGRAMNRRAHLLVILQ